MQLLKAKIADAVNHQVNFNNNCLKGQTCNATEFLKEVSYQVNLQDLYKVKDTSYNGSELLHCAILLEIINSEIKKEYNDAKYLLQVWKDCKVIHQVPLKNELRLWASSGNYFMYIPSQGDEGHEFIHIFHEDKPDNIERIKNFGQEADVKFIAFKQEIISEEGDDDKDPHDFNLLCCASEKEISIIKFDDKAFTSEKAEIRDATKGMSLRKVTPGCKIHYLIHGFDHGQFLFAFETIDNQLEFNKFLVNDIGDNQKFTYKFAQYTEIQPRKEKTIDPIKKCMVKYNGYYSYAIAMRNSGYFDIYWDCQRKDSSSQKILDFDMSTSAFFVKMIYTPESEVTPDGEINLNKSKRNEPIAEEALFSIQHNGESSITCDQLERIPKEELEFDQISLKDAQSYVYLYPALQIIKLDNNSIIIAHNKFLSIFDVIRQKWIKHIRFQEDDIQDFFQIKDNKGKKLIGVTLYNGDLYFFTNDEFKKLTLVTGSQRRFKIDGKILKVQADEMDHKTYLIIFEKDGEYKVQMLYKNNLIDVHEFEGIGENTNIIAVQYNLTDSYLLVQNDNTKVKVYKYHYTKEETDQKDDDEDEGDGEGGEDGNEEEENKEGENEGQGEGDEEKKDDEAEHEEEDEEEGTKNKGKKGTGSVQKKKDDEEEDEEYEGGEDENTAAKNEHTGDTVQFVEVLDLGIQKDLTEELHSAILYGKEENKKSIFEAIVLVDNENIYVVNITDKKCIKYAKEYCLSFTKIEQQYIYALSQEDYDKGLKEGLRIYNLQDIIQNKRCKNIQLKDFDVGISAAIKYSEKMARMIYIKSLTHLEIIPNLHQNSIKFIGIDEQGSYLCYKIIKDKFITLSKKGILSTWNMINGKLLQTHKLEGDWFQKYVSVNEQDYSEEAPASLQQRALIRTSESLEGYDYNDFYEPWQKAIQMKNQVGYLDDYNPKVHEWKYIEIKNEIEIKEIFSFIYPKQQTQEMYINNKGDLMIQKLRFNKTYIYQILPGGQNGKHKLQMIQRLSNYPDELEIDDDLLQCFSPDFSQNLYMDIKRRSFIIKDTLTNAEICKIPTDIMTFKKQAEATKLIRRFKWMDNSRFRLANLEGYEKIFDYTDGFKEIEYNKIPEWNNFKDDWSDGTFYFYKKKIAPSDVLSLLKRKYQTYKSAVYIDKVTDDTQFYEDLISIDPRNIQYSILPWTYLDWRLIEQICSGEIDNINEINEVQVQKMLYNILPGGQTVLHKLCDKEQTDDLIAIFKIAHPNQTIKYHVPFLPNFKGESPLHIASKKNDFKTVNLFLKNLSLYDIEHHSRAIKDLLPFFIEKEVPELLPYLESRMLQTRQVKAITKGCIKEGHSGIISSEIWFQKSQFNNEVMDKESKVENLIKCEFIDIPDIYHYNDKDFEGLFDTLANTEWYDIFTKKPIKHLINYNFEIVKEYTIKKLFIPFCFFQLFFIFYFNYIYELYQEQKLSHAENSETFKFILVYVLNIICISMLGLFATYFIKNEIKQLITKPAEYFSSFWNYVDVIPVAGIYSMILMQFYPGTPREIQVVIQSITTFVMWMKFLYFMRIFKGTGYYIGMIFQVISDIRYFMLILFVALTAFGDSFLSISMANSDSERFTTSMFNSFIYTYLLILGDFNTDDFGSISVYMAWFFFLLCTFFNMIVMLNLLISIVSEAFAKVNGNAENASYKEMAALIAENGYLIPDWKKEEYSKQNCFLLVVQNLDAADKEFTDPIREQFDQLKTKFDDLQKQNEKQDQVLAKVLIFVEKIKKNLLPYDVEEEEEPEEEDDEGWDE